MALITCPECGGKVSDQADVCIHCGYPLSKIKDEQKNEQTYQLTISSINNDEAVARLERGLEKYLFIHYGDPDCQHDALYQLVPKKFGKKASSIEQVILVDGITLENANYVKEKLWQYDISVVESKTKLNNKKNDIVSSLRAGQTICPICGSKDIDVANRGFSLAFGWAGSGRSLNVCRKCGHKWDPEDEL